MKKIICFSVGALFFSLMALNLKAQILLPEVNVTASTVPAKVDEAFKTTFTDAVDPTWYKINKNYLVKFLTNDMKNQAAYKKNGSMVYQIAYGFEKDIPEDVLSLVKSKFPDYSIMVGFNVKQDNRDIWVVNLENDKYLIKARVEDGNVEEAERTRKSK